MKVVVVVRNGVVTQVLTDNIEIQVLVLDHDTHGCDDSSLFDVSGEDVALDVMHQGIAKQAAAEVNSIFGEVLAELRDLEGSSEKASALVTALS